MVRYQHSVLVPSGTMRQRNPSGNPEVLQSQLVSMEASSQWDVPRKNITREAFLEASWPVAWATSSRCVEPLSLVTKGEGWNIDLLVNRDIPLSAQLQPTRPWNIWTLPHDVIPCPRGHSTLFQLRTMLSVSRSICCLCSLNLVLLLCSLGPDCSHPPHLLPIVPTPSQCIYTSISLTLAPDAPVSCIPLSLNCGFLCLDLDFHVVLD